MSKSARIMALAKQGKTTREIACAVYATKAPTQANLAYVRVVRDQRKGGWMSQHDYAYRQTEAYLSSRRSYMRDYMRQYRLDAANESG